MVKKKLDSGFDKPSSSSGLGFSSLKIYSENSESNEPNSIWWVQADKQEGCTFTLKRGAETVRHWVNPGGVGILSFKSATLNIPNGNMYVEKFCFDQFVKLQAFIDTALEHNSGVSKPIWQDFSKEVFFSTGSEKNVRSWIVNLNMNCTVQSSDICSLLRSNESYWMVRFLLDSYAKNLTLQSMRERYGLSPSHFRRITKQALGNSTKNELCQWRLSNALLELLENNLSITDIAIKHGYASLSHFSNEVKSVFGIPPLRLKNFIDRER